MSFTIHTSIETIPDQSEVAYFKKGYFESQDYHRFIGYIDDQTFIAFDLSSETAISIPRSPFGSFFCDSNKANSQEVFIENMLNDLNKRGIKTLHIHHPSSIYSSFVNPQSYGSLEVVKAYVDINQHIELKSDWEGTIHKMQQRKLDSLRNEGFSFQKMEDDQMETAHKFLTVCRQAQGLQINISWEQLKTLTEKLPDTYECFGVFREEKISALCIAVKVTPEIAYYYLPATSPMFRDKSPMVLLIAGMVAYYRDLGLKHLDLGVSSLHGKPQETLRIFKERMGAIETEKPTFSKAI